LWARRLHQNGHYDRELTAITGQNVFDLPERLAHLDDDISTTTGITFSNGIEINIQDRLVIDLLATGDLDFVAYSYLAVRFMF
jgi:hypothetical protein